RHIALYIARLEFSLVERRRKQQNELLLFSYQILFHGGHGLLGALGVGRTRNDGPGLCNRINLALVVLVRPERRSVIEISPAIPPAAPGVLFEGGAQELGALAAPVRSLRVGMHVGQDSEIAQYCHQEPAYPDALTFPSDTHPVHAVVPVPCPHKGQPVRSQLQTVFQGPYTVLVEGAFLLGSFGQAVLFLLAWP